MSSREGSDEELLFDGRENIRPQVLALNVETQNDRFSLKNDQIAPTIATWRSNLAASSQRRNLLFAAYGSDIYVWVPTGPFQLLGTDPEMIIRPVMENPVASGYIDRSNPHTINNILVDDLGRDEILLLVTDSGNVCAYHVESIYSAVTRCASRGDKRPFDGSEVTPFFVENVGMSAWGLATHKYARLIAVSANTGQITIFAFALVDSTLADDKNGPQSSSDQDLGHLDRTWVHIHSLKQFRELRELMPVNHRSRNLRLTYRGHFDNIPSISFANFDLDPNGEWMVSTDISNRVIVWRVWDSLYPNQVYYPGHPENNPPQRGWTVLPLDPRTFKRHQSREEACGCEPKFDIIGERTILDLSRAVEEINDASQVFIFGDSEPRFPEDYTLPNEIFSENPHIGQDPRTSEQSNTENGAARHDNSDTDADSEDEAKLPHAIRDNSRLSGLFEDDNEHYRIAPHLHYSCVNDQLSDSGFDLLKDQAVHPRSPSFFPVIHFSEHHISLASYPLDSEYHLLCKNPLAQRSSPSIDIHSACDRFNMVKYIPEVGIVVAASQKGRVAIISLTWQQEIGFAFRVDWIVPFLTQEFHNQRPVIPLLGLAVSPMPGFENPPDVPCVPQGIDPADWLSFNYRSLDANEDDEVPSQPSSSSTSDHQKSDLVSRPNPTDQSMSSSDSGPESESESVSESEPGPGSEADKSSEDISISDHFSHEHTLPELHAQASSGYRPDEPWHGSHPSRHYRLLLLYADHTVMSYEFWHDWNG
ncbi:hypothetical protein N7504_007163 [Penicillium tannophilum]|nr:hypothetical protein N7504_007163 [Penicillium tannophilum]